MYLRSNKKTQKNHQKNRTTQIGCVEIANFAVENEIATFFS